MQNRIIPPPMLLTAKQAAAAMQISERTLWAISAPRGPLPVVRIQSRVLYDPADLQRYVDAQKSKGGAA